MGMGFQTGSGMKIKFEMNVEMEMGMT